MSKKSISQVAEILKAKGCCHFCDKLFVDGSHISEHSCKAQNKVKIFTSMEDSILMFCHINERNKSFSHLQKRVSLLKSPLKRPLNQNVSVSEKSKTTAKRRKELEEQNQESSSSHIVKTWTCECNLAFPSEELVEKHIFSANRISHKCAVCGKLAENASIIRLHMSRIHGGAHLVNFLFWCRTCNVAIQKGEAVMAHVTEFHGGHSYYCEEDIVKPESVLPSDILRDGSFEQEDRSPSPMDTSPPLSPMDLSEDISHQEKWQCRMCEEIFDSEDAVKQHCMSLEGHHFHRYSCGLCKLTYRKRETLYRHCQDKHSGVTEIKYFCGFCGDLFFDAEEEFLLHFKGFHSTDYVCVCDRVETSIKTFEVVEEGSLLSCGCREKYISKENRKADYKKCQEAMLEKGNLWFRCTLCSSTAQNLGDMMAHLRSHAGKSTSQELYVVRCGACNKNFNELAVAHQHFHAKHSFLQKPQLGFGSEAKSDVFQFSATRSSVDQKPDKQALAVAMTTIHPKSISLDKTDDTEHEQANKPSSEIPGQGRLTPWYF